MISELSITDQHKNERNTIELKTEMATPNEWIVEDERRPDEFIRVTVGAGMVLWALCCCDDGQFDTVCPHAVDVIAKIRANPTILAEIFGRTAAAAA